MDSQTDKLLAVTAQRSSKPLSQKLGVKEGEKAVAVNVPSNVQMTLGKVFITQTGAPSAGEFDLVLYFATDKVLLGKDLPQIGAALKPGGRLWIAYPKGKAIKTDFNRDTLKAFLHQKRWQGVSLVAIDDVWAAMRFKPSK